MIYESRRAHIFGIVMHDSRAEHLRTVAEEMAMTGTGLGPGSGGKVFVAAVERACGTLTDDLAERFPYGHDGEFTDYTLANMLDLKEQYIALSVGPHLAWERSVSDYARAVLERQMPHKYRPVVTILGAGKH